MLHAAADVQHQNHMSSALSLPLQIRGHQSQDKQHYNQYLKIHQNIMNKFLQKRPGLLVPKYGIPQQGGRYPVILSLWL